MGSRKLLFFAILVIAILFFTVHPSGAEVTRPGESGFVEVPAAETVVKGEVNFSIWPNVTLAGKDANYSPLPINAEFGLLDEVEVGFGLSDFPAVDDLSSIEQPNLRLNTKYRFFSDRNLNHTIAVIGAVEELTSTPDFGIGGIVQKKICSSIVVLNAGYLFTNGPGDPPSGVTLGGGYSYALNREIDLIADLKGRIGEENILSANAGLRYYLLPRILLFFGGSGGVEKEESTWRVLAGVTLKTLSERKRDQDNDGIPDYRDCQILVAALPVVEEEIVEEKEFHTPTPEFKIKIPLLELPKIKD